MAKFKLIAEVQGMSGKIDHSSKQSMRHQCDGRTSGYRWDPADPKKATEATPARQLARDRMRASTWLAKWDMEDPEKHNYCKQQFIIYRRDILKGVIYDPKHKVNSGSNRQPYHCTRDYVKAHYYKALKDGTIDLQATLQRIPNSSLSLCPLSGT